MNQEELEEAFEIEKNNLKVKYLIITVFVAVVVALLSSELSLMYYSNKYVDLNKIEKSYNDAKNKVDAKMQESMSAMTGGLNLGGLKLPF